MLGWALVRAGIPFRIADKGQAAAASRVAAGIINPVTGRRLVKSWRVDALLPFARAAYGAIEAELGITLWRDCRVHRLFADDDERARYLAKAARDELAPYSENGDDSGFWIRGAARVDLGTLLTATRVRWMSAGWLQSGPVDISAEVERHDLVIDCTGAALALAATAAPTAHPFGHIPWEFSKGEVIKVGMQAGPPEDVILNRRHWLMPIAPGIGWVGATHEPGIRDTEITPAAKTALEASAASLLQGTAFTVTAQRAGVRVNLPDRRPIAGRARAESRVGVINGLGAKGALWAPYLAQQWLDHVRAGTPFDPEVAASRFD